MGPSSRSSSSDFSMSPSLPPYKPEEEEEHGEEGEEDVGLLSATSNRLQHIASRRLNGKSGRRHHTSRSWSRLSKLLVPVFTVTALLLGGFAIAGRGIIVHARGSHNGNTDDTGKKKVLNLAGELNGLVPECELHIPSFYLWRWRKVL